MGNIILDDNFFWIKLKYLSFNIFLSFEEELTVMPWIDNNGESDAVNCLNLLTDDDHCTHKTVSWCMHLFTNWTFWPAAYSVELSCAGKAINIYLLNISTMVLIYLFVSWKLYNQFLLLYMEIPMFSFYYRLYDLIDTLFTKNHHTCRF